MKKQRPKQMTKRPPVRVEVGPVVGVPLPPGARLEEPKPAANRRSGITTILIGGELCGGGLLVMFATSGSASSSIAIGLIALGVGTLIRGYWRLAFA